MNHENQMIDALLQLMAWDIPDEQLGDALNSQAKLNSGTSPEDCLEEHTETH